MEQNPKEREKDERGERTWGTRELVEKRRGQKKEEKRMESERARRRTNVFARTHAEVRALSEMTYLCVWHTRGARDKRDFPR